MKQFISVSILVFAILLSSCGHKHAGTNHLTREDSIRILSERAFQAQLSDLQKVREELYGPAFEGDPAVSKGDKFKTNIMDDSTTSITGGFEKLKAKLEHAQKDSSTLYGALLTRFRLLNTQHKYLTGTYTDEAHLLRYTSEITFDDKHEEDRDFYFTNNTLIYFRERRTFTMDEQDLMTEDSYFLRNGKVTYAYRDEGTALELKDRMNVMSLKRFQLKGDLTSHVGREFNNFKQDYEILLNQPLEPLIYPGEAKAQ
jgi:hypothetical protein